MLQRFLRLTLISSLTAALGVVVASCSSAPQQSRPVGQGGTGGGGQGGTGGGQGGVGGSQGGVGGSQGGSGGSGASGGSGGAQTQCPTGGTPCCGGLGTCVPTSCLISSQSDQLAQDACASTSEKCAPSDILSGQLPATCRSVDNAEGRCASTCIPLVAVLIDRLPQSTCSASERCAPCYNPIDGQPSGICNIGTDAPAEPAYVFQTCGNNRGKCVPADLVPPAQASLLPPDSCPSGKVCAPTEALLDPNFKFPSCTSTALVPTACNCPGACVPKYLADSQTGGGLLRQDNCTNPDDRCAPCTNPATQQPSGACF